MVLVNLERKAKHFSIILLRLEILALSEVADRGFYWKILICELFKDKVTITLWSHDYGFYIRTCHSLPCHAMHFLHYSILGLLFIC